KRWRSRHAHRSSSGFSETSETTSVTARSTLSAYIIASSPPQPLAESTSRRARKTTAIRIREELRGSKISVLVASEPVEEALALDPSTVKTFCGFSNDPNL